MTARLPRSDVRDNHDRILDAARALFVAGGPEPPVREIARRARVGPATVYRHFPTKQALLAAAFTERSRVWRAVLEGGLADPDPWRGFQVAVMRLCELQAGDRGFTAAFKTAFPRAVDFAGLRASSLTSAAALLDRVRATGRLRPGVGLGDLLLMLGASGGVRANSAAARRYAELTVLAFRAG